MNINAGFSIENYLGGEDIFDANNNIKNGYKIIRLDNFIKTPDFHTFIERLAKEFKMQEFDYSSSKFRIEKKYVTESFVVNAIGNSKEINLTFFCKNETICNYLYKLYVEVGKAPQDTDVFAFFESYFFKGNQIDKSTKTFKYKDVEGTSELYYPYIDTDLLFEQFTTGQENILILAGDPGLGKTKFSNLLLKYMFENPEHIPYDKSMVTEDEIQFICVWYIKNTDILVNDEFWRKLQQDFPDLVILDDLDYMLTKRDSEVLSAEDAKKNEFLNQLLSFTDGIEKNQTKFIITTNQHFEDVDKALLRKGRLFDILEFRKLSLDEAKKVWLEEGLDEKDFDKTFQNSGIHEIPASDLGSEIAKRNNKRSKNTLKTYLKEEGISRIPKKTKRMQL